MKCSSITFRNKYIIKKDILTTGESEGNHDQIYLDKMIKVDHLIFFDTSDNDHMGHATL